jgi:hypothetical protein
MKEISLDNGTNYKRFEDLTVEDKAVIKEYWDALMFVAFEEIVEEVHNELSPCDELSFLKRYLELSPEDLVLN